jgi:hypothetical protein
MRVALRNNLKDRLLAAIQCTWRGRRASNEADGGPQITREKGKGKAEKRESLGGAARSRIKEGSMEIARQQHRNPQAQEIVPQADAAADQSARRKRQAGGGGVAFRCAPYQQLCPQPLQGAAQRRAPFDSRRAPPEGFD